MSPRETVRRFGVTLAGVGLVACASGPAGPSKVDAVPPSWVTFVVDGRVTETTGFDVPIGARVTAEVHFDPDADGTLVPGNPLLPDPESPDSYVYPGVAVEVTVESETVRANARATSTVALAFLVPVADVFSVDVPSGFASGRIAGQTIRRFTMALLMMPSRWPDRSLPLDPALFQSGFTSPGNNYFCLGDCRPFSTGTALGELTSIRRLD